jgi:hypothetical protein
MIQYTLQSAPEKHDLKYLKFCFRRHRPLKIYSTSSMVLPDASTELCWPEIILSLPTASQTPWTHSKTGKTPQVPPK